MTQDAIEAYEWLARIDPAYDDARRKLAQLVEAPGTPTLAVKYREIIMAVVLGCRRDPAIDTHLRRALSAGATLRDMLEAFQAAVVLDGFPALHYALPFLAALHKEFGDKILGVKIAAPSVTAPAKKSVATGPVSRGMREWAWLDQMDPAYDGARRDITALVWTPAAPVLPVKIRELVACVVLAYRTFPTLDGHLRRAVREGASVRELLEGMEAASLPGGFPILHYSLPFLNALHDEIEAGTFV
jgi:alkylhydroperoxidase/carboxymuconolactone decarboxylase family protein YurZ